MHQRYVLVLLVATFTALTLDIVYAKDSIRVTNSETASYPVIVNDGNAHRSLKKSARAMALAAVEDEERIKFLSFLTRIFQKNPKVNSAVKNSPDVVKGLKDPKVSQTIKELQGKKGFLDHLKSLPGVKTLAERLRGRSAPLTTTNVKEIGAVAMKSSGKWKDTLTHLWVKYGAIFLFALGIFFLFGVVVYSIAGR
ncbi:unnamed protein product [Phytophthora fragariaefolia]|uniref:Unnamed protein product n=1 Tax=Phytophthora fragariaefolia TaxID=1490495 RepID=A0A9W6U9X5_9STRA|nr:unnamed protein product [Phytophthora fragariaefolia]